MAKNVENKEEITFNEFRAWLTGVLRGKRGQLPDLNDWKQIKIMMDKVEEGVKRQDFPLPPTYQPSIFIDPPPTMNPPWYPGHEPWCTTSLAGETGVQFTLGDLNIEIPELNEPSLGNIEDITITGLPQTTEEFDKNVIEFNEAMEQMLKIQDDKNGS